MSGGEKKKKNTRSQGWEEAGAEFYQESYPGDSEIEVLWKDPKRLATLLPSKQTRAVATTLRLRTNDTRTIKNTLRRCPTSRSRRDSTVHRRASVAGEVQVSMLPDLSEMKSNEQTAWEEIMELKNLPIPMAEKRERKAKILSEPNLRLQGFEQFKWKRRKAWHLFSARIKESYHKMQLWGGDLKSIEGHFGTGVAVFFHFVKWLFFLNLFIFSLILLFITLPTILLDEDKQEICSNFTENGTCFANYFCVIKESNLFLEIAQGTGRLEKTSLFYGFYSNKTFEYRSEDTTLYYNLPMAYMLVTLIYFFTSLVAIIRTGAKGFRERLVEGEGQFYQYSNLIFGGWDFCIQNQKSARMKHKAIFSEIKALLETEKREEERQSRTKNEKYRIFFVRCLVNSTVIAVLILCAGFIYFVFDFSTQQLKNIQDSNGTFLSDWKFQQLFYEFIPSISIVFLNMVVPFIFTFLVTYENYSPIFVIRLTLIRTVLLRLASLLVLYASMYNKIVCDKIVAEGECTACSTPKCWETYVGQQIYKLLLTDFATHLVITFVVNFARGLLARHIENRCIKFIGEQSFDLPRHVLDVIYTQTLCWVGMFFAPLLSVAAIILFFFLFYIKKFACMVNCKPSMIIYRASRSNSMFMVVLLVSYIVALVPIAFTVSELSPSKSCGPFQHLPTIWELIVDTFNRAPMWIQAVAAFIPTAGFAIPLFIVLILLLYYYTAINSANRHMVIVLKNQLVLEGHDKQFLIDRLYMFIKQENDKRQKMAERDRQRVNDNRHSSH